MLEYIFFSAGCPSNAVFLGYSCRGDTGSGDEGPALNGLTGNISATATISAGRVLEPYWQTLRHAAAIAGGPHAAPTEARSCMLWVPDPLAYCNGGGSQLQQVMA